jgi:aminoglycoside/choline kinase family phosphotransferase
LIPQRIADLTPAFLSEALGHRVAEVSLEPVGTGQVADSARITFVWDPPESGPPTLVAKVTSASDVSRAIARITRTYEVEVGFYNDLAPQVGVNAPACHFAAHDPETGAYCVILDDLAPCEQGDQMRGCTPDEAALALRELPELHAPGWDDPLLDALPWIKRRDPAEAEFASAYLTSLLPGFFDRYADRLDDDVIAMTERAVPVVTRHALPAQGATIIHNDFRCDNLMFGGPRVWVLDWQTVAIGDGLLDVSYFLGGSLLVDDRREHEEELVRAYVEDLTSRGIAIGFDEGWTRYRRNAFAGLIMAIGASMNVERTERGDEMFVAMANRAGRHILDLDAEALGST